MRTLSKLTFAALLAISSLSAANAQDGHGKIKDIKVESEGKMPAIRLINNPDGTCTFEEGFIPTLKHTNTTTFWSSNKTEDWEKNAHPAPRRQYVVTLKGKIKFKVSDGSTFVIQPGTILLAEDLKGKGHSWEMVHSKSWERLYIPITEGADDLFTAK
jgi:quercetin dioxygenase-like cupin family protein